ncbi:MAG: class I SAM-dependent methyltransferase [Anaerolineales bacterium]
MSLNWIEVTHLPFNVLLLLEREQISWLPGWVPEEDLGIALHANPCVAWYLKEKCPDIKTWVEQVLSQAEEVSDPEQVREAEIEVMNTINDLLVYVVDPALYDELPFLGWDSEELSGLVDFEGRDVIDVGAGTGRLAFVAAEEGAHAVFAVEPVGNLRRYMKRKAHGRGLSNLFPVDGLITDIPFPDDFVDVCMGGHVFGDAPEEEHGEMVRVTKPGGMVILCPGNNDRDEGWHDFLVEMGFAWSRFLEPEDGWKRKYWKRV